MKTNRLISLLLALVMLAALVPASVFADSEDISAIGVGSPELFEELFNDFEIPETVADLSPELHVYADAEHTDEILTFDRIKAGERYFYEIVLRPGKVLTEFSVLSKDADNASFVAPCDGVGAFMLFSMNVVMPGDVSIPYDDLYEYTEDSHGDVIEKDYTPTINARDVTTIMKLIVGIKYDKSGRFEIREENADYNLDTKVNARDVTMVMKRIVGRPDPMAQRLAGGVQKLFDVRAEAALFGACVPGSAEPGERNTSTMTLDELGALITDRLSMFDESFRDNAALLWGLYGLTPPSGDDADGAGYSLFDILNEYFAFMKTLGMPDPVVVTVDGVDCREDGHPVVRRVSGTSNDAEAKHTAVDLSDVVVDCAFGEYTSNRLFGDSGYMFSEDTFDGVRSCTLALITLPGLVFDDVETNVTGTIKTSEIAANEAVEYPDARTTGERMTDFSFDMLRDLAIDYENTCEVIDKNVFISPVSVAFALAMAANGAEGETRAYFERLFGDVDELNGGLQALWYSLTSDRETKLTLADSVWIRAGLTVLDSYLETLKAYYRGELYADQPFDSTTTAAINAWVSDNTLGLIKELVTDDVVASAALLLLNAVGFEGKWASPFDGVSKHKFTSLDGTSATVDMMSGKAERYIDIGVAEGFAKDYENGQYSLVVLVPKDYFDYYSDDPADVSMDENELREYMLEMTLADLDSYWFYESLNDAEFSPISVRMPKFNIEYSLSFKDDIFTDGRLPAPFDPSRADFSGITGDTSLYIKDVIHKAVIEVNEYGTKAAAATAVIFEKNASPAPKEYAVTVDRPFVYMIIENSTNVPVFVGVVTDLDAVTPAD